MNKIGLFTALVVLAGIYWFLVALLIRLRVLLAELHCTSPENTTKSTASTESSRGNFTAISAELKSYRKRNNEHHNHHPQHHPHHQPPLPQKHISSDGNVKYIEVHSNGFSSGSGLRSIAQGSANQAHTAVSNQHAAAQQAAFIAKSTLAQAASQASATAQAALAGKHVWTQGLEKQLQDSHGALLEEIELLNLSKKSAKASQKSAQIAYNHVSILTAALNNAKALAEHAEKAANEAASILAAQSSMVGKAKLTFENLQETLNAAREELAATKEAAIKASSSAAEAQANAEKAAVEATGQLHEVASNGPKDYELSSEIEFEEGGYGDHV